MWQRLIVQRLQSHTRDGCQRARDDGVRFQIGIGTARQERTIRQLSKYSTTASNVAVRLEHLPSCCHITIAGQSIRKAVAVV